MQYYFSFAFVLTAAAACAVKKCPVKEDNTVHLSEYVLYEYV